MVSAGHVDGTCGSDSRSIAADLLWMSGAWDEINWWSV